MFLDNGLTLEQQERMDNIYESLMSDLKSIDIKLYQRLRKLKNGVHQNLQKKMFIS